MSCGTASFLHVLNIINLSFDTYDIGLRAPHQTQNTVVWSNWMMASNEQEGDQRETIIQKTCPWWSMCLVKDGWDFCLIHLWHMSIRSNSAAKHPSSAPFHELLVVQNGPE